MVRTPCCDKSGMRKGTWTPEEDRKLTAYITRYGCWNWRRLPKYAGLMRCGKSCRLRWMNYLRPNIKRGNYNKEEEETIIRLHESLGNRWSAIAAQLPGRTDNEIKNHWHTNLKKMAKDEHNSARNEKILISKTTRNGGATPPPNLVAAPILESSPFSQQSSPSSSSSSSSSSSGETSSSTTDTAGGVNDSYDGSFASLETVEELSGNFWTEPFFGDNFYVPNDSLASPMVDPDILFHPPLSVELLYCDALKYW